MPNNFYVSQQFFIYGSKFEIAKGYKYRNLLENLFDLDLGGNVGSLLWALVFTSLALSNQRKITRKTHRV